MTRAKKRKMSKKLDTGFMEVEVDEMSIHISCITLSVLHTLLKRGINATVIDNKIYADVDIPDFDEIVKDCSIKYYNEWLKDKN